jgi:hypothetical protein
VLGCLTNWPGLMWSELLSGESRMPQRALGSDMKGGGITCSASASVEALTPSSLPPSAHSANMSDARQPAAGTSTQSPGTTTT